MRLSELFPGLSYDIAGLSVSASGAVPLNRALRTTGTRLMVAEYPLQDRTAATSAPSLYRH